MAGGLELNDLEGYFQPKPFNDLAFPCSWHPDTTVSHVLHNHCFGPGICRHIFMLPNCWPMKFLVLDGSGGEHPTIPQWGKPT